MYVNGNLVHVVNLEHEKSGVWKKFVAGYTRFISLGWLRDFAVNSCTIASF